MILESFEFHTYNEMDDVNGKDRKKGSRRWEYLNAEQ